MAGTPKYPQKPHSSGQARIRLRGRAIYLGKWGTPESHAKYHRVIAEHLAGNEPDLEPDAVLTVAELVSLFYSWAEKRYQKAGTPTSEIRSYRYALRPVVEMYSGIPAASFGPQALIACRQKLVEHGYTRRRVNGHVSRIRNVWRWGVEREYLPPDVLIGLQAVRGLRREETDAPEPRDVPPAPLEHVEAIREYVTPPVWAMIQFQLYTGCRPGEARIVRTCDVRAEDAAVPAQLRGQVWVYRPASHKTEHHGKHRLILCGPRAQDLLTAWMQPAEPERYLFRPCEGKGWRQRQKSGGKPKRIRDRHSKLANRPYKNSGYSDAVRFACQRAGIPPWTPNQLRHTAATEIRRQYGAEMSRIILGHSDLRTTEIYAERDMEAAAKAMLTWG